MGKEVFSGNILWRVARAPFIREKEYAAAEASLRKALNLAPGDKEILRDLACVQQAQKNYLSGGRR